ncbi:hypothetical protein QW131_17605 [Roseibium salinum]|nr:hypothetical protein [Roseibium salinum]
MDAKAIADSSAKSDDATAVGIAVAINVADMTNQAIIGTGTTIDADGLVLSATMKNVGGNLKHDFEAKSVSGASAGDIGVAGSFALSVVHTDTHAVSRPRRHRCVYARARWRCRVDDGDEHDRDQAHRDSRGRRRRVFHRCRRFDCHRYRHQQDQRGC